MSLERGMATVAVLGSSPLFRAGLVSLLGTMGFGRVEEADNIRELKIEELKRRANDASGPESGPRKPGSGKSGSGESGSRESDIACSFGGKRRKLYV